jgi:hypothetical protein
MQTTVDRISSEHISWEWMDKKLLNLQLLYPEFLVEKLQEKNNSVIVVFLFFYTVHLLKKITICTGKKT